MTPPLLRPLPWCPSAPPPGPPPGPTIGTTRQDPGALGPELQHDPPLLLLIDRRLARDIALQQRLEDSLSESERQHLAALRLAADRERFRLGRGSLRLLLGTWLELPPQAVPLATGRHGKPHCPDGPPFNVSHSGDLILLALHPQRSVGVDVERLRPDLDWPALARRLLSAAEQAALAACPPHDRPEAFLAAWCRLEARLKARGDGLAGLERLRRQEMAEAHPPANAASECIWDVVVPEGYRAAAALAALAAGEG